MNGAIGYGIPVSASVMLTPYGEMGFRYWNRKLGNGEVEDYNNLDMLAGLRYNLRRPIGWF